ncbi:DNA-binding MarR family transcriptional regulator [Anaerosolibacter carboniphilus]|uniref:DNA-binding MarR family transcriptional regulator n=1 Tax=Anaerosolibacter carboniphilus TaxID=1417629 RepID=A0A841KPY8_9FIRM|nr:MarR family transcriptional regulator [Anaerosolibacter carboniphilus]MBB6214168.1 DNA-binding MarR family transcriptional regulator [Anaerosolibacter carboniphilus]
MVLDENKMDLRISVMKQLFVLHKKFMNTVLTVFADDEISRTEIMILMLLKKKEYRVTSLAKEIGIPASTLTGVIDRLINKGYVERYRSTEDRRAVIVGVGTRTKEKIEQVNEKIQSLAAATGHDLPDVWWEDLKQKLNEVEKIIKMLDEESTSI